VTFAPRLDALPPPQRALWPELAAVPHRYVLYGGTALALRFAHRPSVDFDFFAHDPLDHRELEDALPWLRRADALQESANTRTVLVRGDGGGVKVSFFGGIAFGRVGEPEASADSTLRAASLADLAGTKIKALVQRVEAKDYLDIIALLDHGIALATILGAARALFGPAFNPIVAQKALTYFEGGDLATLSDDAKGRLVAEAARDLDVPVMPLVSPRLD
jgi:hypothetical protein